MDQQILETSSLSSENEVTQTPTLDLDKLVSAPISPLTNPASYPETLAPQQVASSKKTLSVVFGVLGVILL